MAAIRAGIEYQVTSTDQRGGVPRWWANSCARTARGKGAGKLETDQVVTAIMCPLVAGAMMPHSGRQTAAAGLKVRIDLRVDQVHPVAEAAQAGGAWPQRFLDERCEAANLSKCFAPGGGELGPSRAATVFNAW